MRGNSMYKKSILFLTAILFFGTAHADYKFDYLSEEDFKIALKSTNNISKHHPSNFQKKVILSLNSKLEEVQMKYNLVLQREHA